MSYGATKAAILASLDTINNLFKLPTIKVKSARRALSSVHIDEDVSVGVASPATTLVDEQWLRQPSGDKKIIDNTYLESNHNDGFQPYASELQQSSQVVSDSEIDLDDLPDLTDTSSSSNLWIAKDLTSQENNEAHCPKPDLFPGAPRWLNRADPSSRFPTTLNIHNGHKPGLAGSMDASSVTTRSLLDSSETTSESDGTFESDESCQPRFPERIEVLLAIYMLQGFFKSRFSPNGTKCAYGGESNWADPGPSTQQSTGDNDAVRPAPSKRKYSNESNDENRDDDKRKRGSRRFQSGSSSKGSDDLRLFACPFYKRKPSTYPKCQRKELTAVSRVKQHLSRQHQIPIHCASCNMEFENELDLEDHTRSRPPCEPQPKKIWEGVTRDQSTQLQKRSDRNKLPEEQWYDVFRILFPGEPLPESPYMDSEKSQVLQGFRAYVRQEFMSLFEAFIDQEIPEQYGAEAQMMRPYVMSATQRALDMLFNQYNNQVISDSGEESGSGNLIHQDIVRQVPTERSALTSFRQPMQYEVSADTRNLSLIQSSTEIMTDPTGGLQEPFPIYHMNAANQSMATSLFSDFGRAPSQPAFDAFSAYFCRYLQDSGIEAQQGS